jgi:predicted glutamine amidotransferase
MCRIFGFRSVIPSKVHKSLLIAENSLCSQSQRHPDGWGVAYYIQESPHLIRSISKAIDDQLFQQVSGLVSSETVVAHLRKATHGDLNILNTHPFQYGKWVFVHNGHIPQFESIKFKLQAVVPEHMKRFILGSTDSETLFYYFLSYMMKVVKIGESVPVDLVMHSLRLAMDDLKLLIGDHATEDSDSLDKNYLTFLLTNGETMVAYQGGKNLNYSTYKSKCSERNECQFHQHTCENPDEGKVVQHIVFSSEDVKNENIWNRMSPGDFVGVDRRMVVVKA